MKAADFFTLPSSLAAFASHFPADALPWTWLKAIAPALAGVKRSVPADLPPGVHIEGAVFLHPTVKIVSSCTIIGPAWIGAHTEIRPGMYIRGSVIVGEGCVLGNSCEFKNALLMDEVDVPHFTYVGDTILGTKAHLGAGVICSNLRLDQKPVRLRLADGSRIDTGLRKFGAIVGEQAEVGCNAVLQPGTLLGKRALVFPLTHFGGELPPATIATARTGEIVRMPRRD